MAANALRPANHEVVILRVSDTGRGIPTEDISHVFEPFFTTKSVEAGTGLGLAMVYGTVTQHGGHIAVESRVMGGTTFVITLPAAEGTPEPFQPPPQRTAPSARSVQGRILVVEDEPQVRAVFAGALRSRGYEVIEAADGLEALAKVE